MWTFNQNRQYHPMCILLCFCLILTTIKITNHSVFFLLFFLLYLWKSVKNKSNLLKYSTFFAILLTVINSFCGKLLIWIKLCTVFFVLFEFLPQIKKEQLIYYYERWLYSNQYSKPLKLYLWIDFPSLWKKNWQRLQRSKKISSNKKDIHNDIEQIKRCWHDTERDRKDLEYLYQIRFYESRTKRTEIHSKKWTRQDHTILSFHFWIYMILVILKNYI